MPTKIEHEDVAERVDDKSKQLDCQVIIREAGLINYVSTKEDAHALDSQVDRHDDAIRKAKPLKVL